ncbi:hypothetical protein, partial [Longimicrobium sp.]|uniref:hypothetical protein n=1 Tax=Longimicrobium sp. TaxID=2029185 RepID=UPI002E32310F
MTGLEGYASARRVDDRQMIRDVDFLREAPHDPECATNSGADRRISPAMQDVGIEAESLPARSRSFGRAQDSENGQDLRGRSLRKSREAEPASVDFPREAPRDLECATNPGADRRISPAMQAVGIEAESLPARSRSFGRAQDSENGQDLRGRSLR